jgi:hypothetical protein
MKNLFLLILFVCLNASANVVNWPSLSTVYSSQSICRDANPEGDCLAIPSGSIPQALEKVAEMIDDPFSPQWEAASQVTECEGEEACQTALLALTCEGNREKFIDAEFTQVYCTKIVGYDQVATGAYVLAENESLKSAYLAAKAAEDALNAGLQEVARLRAAGQRVISLVILRNGAKNLTDEQVIALHATYATVKSFLEDGSLVRAKAAVEAITPDGVIMTVDDKTAILAEIERHL